MGLPQPGDIFENYKVLKVLGLGGMGQVFLAEDIKLSRKVALKFLGSENQKMDPQTLQRFENEAKILASLNHPNIVNIYTLGSYAGISYLGMEYVPGVTLLTVIEKKSFGVTDSIKAVRQILTGLAEAHGKGILHRDIKPANLLVTEDHKVKIVDFGISKNLVEDDMNLTKENHFIGTLKYMAPELLKGHNPTPASDLFSVGVVFYELLTGKNPFPYENKIEVIDAIRHTQVEVPEEIKKIIPLNLVHVLRKLLAKNKEDRYQSAHEALKSLSDITQEDLPDFMGVSLRPDVVVANRDKVNTRLAQKGYKEHEIEIILKLAAKLEELNTVVSSTEDADLTLDLSLTQESGEINISFENLEMAIQEYEATKSKSYTDLTRLVPVTDDPTVVQESTKPKTKIPFPLFRPKIVIISAIVFVLLGVNFWVYKQFFPNETHSTNIVKKIEQLVPKYDGTEIKRSLSSVPAGKLKHWQIGLQFEFKTRKIDKNSGKLIFDHKNLLKVKKIEDNVMFAYLKNGGNGKWSSQHLSINAFEPPRRWYRKRGFNLKNTVKGPSADIYPVNIGKSASFSYETFSRKRGAINHSKKDCKVEDTEKLTLAGKEFQTFKVDCKIKSELGTTTSILNYSPELNMVIKSTSTFKGKSGHFEETMELSRIKN